MQADPLAQLRDIQLPEAISWWPLAPGWWILIMFAASFLGWTVFRLLKHHRSNLYRRQAIKKISRINAQQDLTVNQKLVLLFETLKQTIKSAYPDQNFSSRDLNVFVNILQQSCSVTIFKDLPADLNVILYGKATVAETGNELVEKLMFSAKIWIEKHHTQTKLEVTTLC